MPPTKQQLATFNLHSTSSLPSSGSLFHIDSSKAFLKFLRPRLIVVTHLQRPCQECLFTKHCPCRRFFCNQLWHTRNFVTALFFLSIDLTGNRKFDLFMPKDIKTVNDVLAVAWRLSRGTALIRKENEKWITRRPALAILPWVNHVTPICDKLLVQPRSSR